MECKYCHAKMPANTAICPKCGKDNTKDDLKVLKIVTLSLVCLVMLVLLVGLVNFGVTGSFVPEWLLPAPTDPGAGNKDTTYKVISKDGFITMKPGELEGFMDDVVATMGEDTLTNGELQIYYWMKALAFSDKIDLTKDLDQQIYDKESGQTYHDYCMEQALKAWQETMMMLHKAEEASYKLPQAAQDRLDSLEEELEAYVQMYNYYYGLNLKNVDDLVAMNYGPGCDFDVYYDFYRDLMYSSMYWDEMHAELEYTEEELQEYFTSHEKEMLENYTIPITKDFGNLIDIRAIIIAPTTKKDDAGKTVTDWEATLKAAGEIYDKWVENGSDEKAFIELVKKYTGDENAKAAEGLYTDLYKTSMWEADVRHILITPDSEGATKDENGYPVYTEKAWADAKVEADALLEKWLKNPTETYFGELANENSDDKNGKVTDGGIYTDVARGKMVKEFEDWCYTASRQEGDYGIVKTVYGYHLMYFVRADREVDDWISDESRKEGDVAILKSDNACYLVYLVKSEPAWYRYSRLGVQAEKADAMLDELVKANPYTLVETDIVIAYPTV